MPQDSSEYPEQKLPAELAEVGDNEELSGDLKHAINRAKEIQDQIKSQVDILEEELEESARLRTKIDMELDKATRDYEQEKRKLDKQRRWLSVFFAAAIIATTTGGLLAFQRINGKAPKTGQELVSIYIPVLVGSSTSLLGCLAVYISLKVKKTDAVDTYLRSREAKKKILNALKGR